jgi:hypothetical protein
VVLADSHEIPRAPCYSGEHNAACSSVAYGGHTLYAGPLKDLRLPPHHERAQRQLDPVHPTTPTAQPLPGLTHDRFSLIRFRSPLLTESLFVFSSYGY